MRDSLQDLRAFFFHYLTVDSKTQDARRKEFNQAIFDVKEGWAIFSNTDLDMVMEKFEKAVKSLQRGERP